MISSKTRIGLLAVTAMLLASPAVEAQQYPSKPIRMVVPFPPGGFVDILGRMLAQRLTEAVGQNVLVDNRPGANANIGIDIVAKAQPDGYTIVLAQMSNLAVNPAVYKEMSYNAQKDLAAIGLVGTAPQVLVVSTASPFKSVADVIAAAKAKPGELMFASSGNGSLGHLGLELIQQQAGIQFTHIPYKGAAPAVVDVIGGRAHLFIAAVPSVMGQIRGGKIKALAVTSITRAADLPDVPPLNEAGFPGYDSTNSLVLMGRAGTPTTIINRLNAALGKALDNADIKSKFAAEGAAVKTSTPQELSQALAGELVKWAQVVKKAGIKAQ